MNIKSKIKRTNIISFDIFDTLLFRPYVKPTDLFLHIEKVYKKPFFRTARMTAEYNARQNTSKEDITFDEIYMQMPQEFQSMKEIELEWEMMVLRPNPEMKLIWDYAKKLGKKIIVTSDMYLSSEFLTRVLHKNGFIGYDKLYVSGEIGKTKTTGTLFEYITNDLQVTPDKILHIGDNKKSDYKSPKKSGLRAILYPHIINDFIKKNPRFDKFFSKNKNDLGASILLSVMILKEHDRKISNDKNIDYWYDLGYKYAGPVIYSYARYIEKIASEQKNDHIMFVARDGYTIQRIFNTFNNSISNSYVYAPRFLNLICRLDYAKEDILQSNAIISYFCKQSKILRNKADKIQFKTWHDYHNFIQSNSDIFSQYARKEWDNYIKYLKNKSNNASYVAIVDTITARFSSQKLIQDSLKTPTIAIYWSVLHAAFEGIFSYEQFIQNNREYKHVFTKNWNFMEFLMTAPEYPIKNLNKDGTPIYDSSPNEAEKIRKKLYPIISDAAVDFSKYIKKLFKCHDIFLSGDVIVSYINSFIDYPKKQDIKNMSCLQHAYDSAHLSYIPLFSVKTLLIYFISRPKKTIQLIKESIWHTTPQTILLCFAYPIKIRMRGLKQIRILLLPKLRYNYLNITFRVNRHCFYQVSIGKPEDV